MKTGESDLKAWSKYLWTMWFAVPRIAIRRIRERREEERKGDNCIGLAVLRLANSLRGIVAEYLPNPLRDIEDNIPPVGENITIELPTPVQAPVFISTEALMRLELGSQNNWFSAGDAFGEVRFTVHGRWPELTSSPP